MQIDPNRRYSISEVSTLLGVPDYLLRQWEERFPQLKPGRSRSNRRYYTATDIDIARRIKQLLHHDRMTTEGARMTLSRELHGEGVPKTRQELVDLAERIEADVREMLDLLDSV